MNFLNLSYDNVNNYWEFYEGDPSIGTSDEESPSFHFPDNEPGIYPVYLEVSNITNCVHDTVVSIVNTSKETHNTMPDITIHKDLVDDFDPTMAKFALERLRTLYGVKVS